MNNLTTLLTIDSREVAKITGKDHRHLLRDIDTYIQYLTKPKVGLSQNLTESKIALSEFFKESNYKDSTGRTLKNYQITQKGCEFIAHKMTGKKGTMFTATYINKFHEMEQQLRTSQMQLKYFRGVPCITIKDVENTLGVSKCSLLYRLKSLEEGSFKLLKDLELIEFKKENPDYNKGAPVSTIIIIFEKGFKALLDYYKIKDNLSVFKDKTSLEQLTTLNEQNNKIYVFDIINNPDIDNTVTKILQTTEFLKQVATHYKSKCIRLDELAGIQSIIVSSSIDVFRLACELKRIKPKIIEL